MDIDVNINFPQANFTKKRGSGHSTTSACSSITTPGYGMFTKKHGVSRQMRQFGLLKVLRALQISYSNDFDHQYNQEDLIAKGATAEVWKATNVYTNKTYAVKKICLEDLQNDNRIASVLIEIHCLNKLRHNNIIKYKKLYIDKDERPKVMIVLELMKCTLYTYIHETKERLSYDVQKIIVKDIAEAINCCHSLNFVHRDVKLENILISLDSSDRKEGNVTAKLADFGFAAHCTGDTDVSGKFGTRGYMAPEIYQDKPYGKKVDIWSLGVVAYYLTAKEMPFKAKTKEEEKRRVELGDYSWKISEVIDGYDESQQKFIVSLLQVDPRVRPTAYEMLQNLWLSDVVVPPSEELEVGSVGSISPVSTAPNSPSRSKSETAGALSVSDYSLTSKNTASTNSADDDMETIILEVPPGFEKTAIEMGAIKNTATNEWHLTSNAFRTINVDEQDNCSAIQIIDLIFGRGEPSSMFSS